MSTHTHTHTHTHTLLIILSSNGLRASNNSCGSTCPVTINDRLSGR